MARQPRNVNPKNFLVPVPVEDMFQARTMQRADVCVGELRNCSELTLLTRWYNAECLCYTCKDIDIDEQTHDASHES